MLELKNISKSYKTGTFVQNALKNVSTKFRKNEFVAILGASGSGKTTLLNIIGGLDRYDSGDLVINNKSTTKFKDLDWDHYRNNCVGFIFQSYNLISHISILNNVEMGMTLSGVSAKTRRRKAKEALTKVGLIEHMHKKPNQLSGGQMQRVAIARALANDPEIILADEPTGALDTKTSIQIMELIKEIAKDKLVIMVTHNPDLAKEYASRIIEFKDGEKINDSNPVTDKEKDTSNLKIKKTAMSFMTALKLSFNNIKTKKGRTILTALASSIGIIGIALILALSNGFDIQIDAFERDTLSNMPINIGTTAMAMDSETMEKMQTNDKKLEKYPDKKEVYPQNSNMQAMLHTNNLTNDYIDYIQKIDKELVAGYVEDRLTNLNIILNKEETYQPLGLNAMSFVTIPERMDGKHENSIIDNYYDVIAGQLPKNDNELLLIVDNKNRVDEKVLKALGINTSDEKVSFDKIMETKLKIVFNDDYFKKVGDQFTINTNLKDVYHNQNSMELKIVGIIRGKQGKEIATSGSGLSYPASLAKTVIEKNKNSEIVKAQEQADYNILTNAIFNEETGETKEAALSYLGAESLPVSINIYPLDFNSKEQVIDYLDAYNEGKTKEEKIVYTDYGSMISSMSGSIMDAITIVLISFSAISLVVSSIMIGIITYISVLERTKEIGILRSLGARKKDISRVFNAETFIIGICSGLLGIGIAVLLTLPINQIIKSLTDLANVARLDPIHALILITVSVLLTLLGGFIPSKMASKKDPVDALRTE